jgi:hypothetical protein
MASAVRHERRKRPNRSESALRDSTPAAPSQQMRARWSKGDQAPTESGHHLSAMLSDMEAIFLASAIRGVAWLAMM